MFPYQRAARLSNTYKPVPTTVSLPHGGLPPAWTGGLPSRAPSMVRGSSFVVIVILATEVAGLALGLLLLGAYVIECVAVEYNADRIIPAQIGVVGEDRAHFLLEVLGHLDRALLHRCH